MHLMLCRYREVVGEMARDRLLVFIYLAWMICKVPVVEGDRDWREIGLHWIG